jgi:hypothetical protein
MGVGKMHDNFYELESARNVRMKICVEPVASGCGSSAVSFQDQATTVDTKQVHTHCETAQSIASLSSVDSGPCSGSTAKAAQMTLKILYLFGGARDDESSFEYIAQRIGKRVGAHVHVDCYDLCKGHDLVDEALWRSLLAKLTSGHYHAKLGSPPSGTFGNSAGTGQALRAMTGPELYGRKGLSCDDAKRVRVATLLALRDAEANRVCSLVGLPWITVQPKALENQPHMFLLDEWGGSEATNGVALKTPICAAFERNGTSSLT